jgi:hypothetical protein
LSELESRYFVRTQNAIVAHEQFFAAEFGYPELWKAVAFLRGKATKPEFAVCLHRLSCRGEMQQ